MPRPLPACALAALVACAGGPAPKGADSAADTAAPGRVVGPSPYTLDDTLRLQHVQALGTHNSTHLRDDPIVHPSHDYAHAPLDVQLEEQGVRQFELDLHLHESLGWQVFHLPAVDDETTCLQLADCLGLLKAWSDRNPWHLPLVIWFEPKDEDLDAAIPELELFLDRHDELEQAVLDVIPAELIVTPDELRGDHPDLPSALAAAGGWPTLGQLRGRFIFSMLDSDAHRAAYLEGHPALEGRLMFVDADAPADPFAAIFKINDAVRDAAEVQAALAAGMMVTSNIDGAGSTDAEAQASLEGSLAAGAHHLSTDYPAPVPERGYHAQIPGGTPARCHPTLAPAGCTAAEVEDLAAARALAGG